MREVLARPRDPRRDRRTVSRSRLDVERAAEEFGPLLHAGEAEPGVAYGGIEPDAVVADGEVIVSALALTSIRAFVAPPCLVALVSDSWVMR